MEEKVANIGCIKASALEALKISPDMIVNTLSRKPNILAGTIYKGNKEVIVRTFAEYNNLDIRNATMCVMVFRLLSEMLRCLDGMAEITSIVRINQNPESGYRLQNSKHT